MPSPAPSTDNPGSSIGKNFRDLYIASNLFVLARALAILSLYIGFAAVVGVLRWQPLSLLLWPAMGLILAGFLAAAHDCAHGSHIAGTGRAGNRWAGTLWCIPILVNYTCFREFHLQHHRHTRVPGDPENTEPIRSVGGYFRRIVLGQPLKPVTASLKILVGCYPEFLRTSSKRRAARKDSVLVGLWLMVMAAMTFHAPIEMLLVYWAPLAWFSPMLAATALPEHYECGEGPDTIYCTRSVTTNRFVRFLLWNGNYHAEHHLYPSIPSSNLPELSRRVRHLPMMRAKSYLSFHCGLLRLLLRERKRSGRSETV